MNNPLDTHTRTPVFGLTRTSLRARHALITSDGFVPSHWPGAPGVTAIFHITPAMGANLVQATIRFEKGGTLPLPATPGVERFLYFTQGTASCADHGKYEPGSYLFIPPGGSDTLIASTPAEATLFEKRYEPLAGTPPPAARKGHERDHTASPFLGQEGAMLKTLLPDEPAFDMAVNIFTYRPGATLPFVETHIMEHGLLMLSGMGVYRLGDDWHPVRAGDVIWMAPYCPQWFVAMGDEPASYIYYKNINRLPALP
jgi:(S)-ureidoglycine aminohydrolase